MAAGCHSGQAGDLSAPAGLKMTLSTLSLLSFVSRRRGVAGRCSVAEVSPTVAASSADGDTELLEPLSKIPMCKTA